MAAIDGLDVLREQLSLHEIMRLIENTAMWVSPKTFSYLPIWFPEEARGDFMYKKWSERQLNTNRKSGVGEHKRVGNENASKALTWALGMTPAERPNWTCCHIWSVDDPKFQKSNSIAGDKRFYSCVANMVLLPTPLKAFTDAMPEVKTMLRVAAASLYGWHPQHPEIQPNEVDRDQCVWDDYPKSWPRECGDKEPLGVVPFNDKIRAKADKRLERVHTDLSSAGKFYPREEVREVLSYWSAQVQPFGDLLRRRNIAPELP